jgi:hypothetical protein
VLESKKVIPGFGKSALATKSLEKKTMDPKIVEKLERELEEAIGDVFARLGLRKLDKLPSQKTLHLMAKAAVTVYEATVHEAALAEHKTPSED